VRGLTRAPRREDFRALAIRTDYRPEAEFASSDADLNAIHEMIARTQACLAYNGYMVDSPPLERAGYGGDGNSSTEILTKPSTAWPRSTPMGTGVGRRDASGEQSCRTSAPRRAGGGRRLCRRSDTSGRETSVA